jgi:sigma-B regulation protein RsbU (phosphoserine phosphatase)
LATAKAIQRSALPRTFPPFPEIDAFDLYASMDAAKEVGGDFYDFFIVDDNTLVFLIADVSGKGIPGALFMMAAKAEIENYLSTGMGPAEAILSVNRRLCATNDAGMFVTVWVATLNWETGELTYVNAGHNFPLLRHGRGGNWEWLKKKCGLFLGTFEIAKYRQETIDLQPGDELILYTDGVNEAFSVNEEEYGNDRLDAFLAAHNDMRHDELVKALRDDVAAWAEGAEQSDDITILVMEYGVDA